MQRVRMGMQCWASSAPLCVSHHKWAARWAAPSVQQVSGFFNIHKCYQAKIISDNASDQRVIVDHGSDHRKKCMFDRFVQIIRPGALDRCQRVYKEI